MKNLFLAAIAALSLGAAIVPAHAKSTIADTRGATTQQQTGGYFGN